MTRIFFHSFIIFKLENESESDNVVFNICSTKKNNPRSRIEIFFLFFIFLMFNDYLFSYFIVKMKKILKLFDEKHYELAENMRTGEGSEVRGICVLSAKFEPSKPIPFYSEVSDEISVNMFCLNYECN